MNGLPQWADSTVARAIDTPRIPRGAEHRQEQKHAEIFSFTA